MSLPPPMMMLDNTALLAIYFTSYHAHLPPILPSDHQKRATEKDDDQLLPSRRRSSRGKRQSLHTLIGTATVEAYQRAAPARARLVRCRPPRRRADSAGRQQAGAQSLDATFRAARPEPPYYLSRVKIHMVDCCLTCSLIRGIDDFSRLRAMSPPIASPARTSARRLCWQAAPLSHFFD